MNSCVKGKVGEREWRDFLRAWGIQAKRGQQHAGGSESPDVASELDYFVHWEVKRVENLSVHKAMEQSACESSPEQIPVVAHRKNRTPWLCTVRAEDLVKLLLIAKGVGVSCTTQIASAKPPAYAALPASPIERLEHAPQNPDRALEQSIADAVRATSDAAPDDETYSFSASTIASDPLASITADS